MRDYGGITITPLSSSSITFTDQATNTTDDDWPILPPGQILNSIILSQHRVSADFNKLNRQAFAALFSSQILLNLLILILDESNVNRNNFHLLLSLDNFH